MPFSLRLYLRCSRCAKYEVHLDTDQGRIWQQAKARGWLEMPRYGEKDQVRHLCPKCADGWTIHGSVLKFPVKIEPV